MQWFHCHRPLHGLMFTLWWFNQDYYFINTEAGKHTMTFTLQHSSIVRFFISFVAPWAVEIKLFDLAHSKYDSYCNFICYFFFRAESVTYLVLLSRMAPQGTVSWRQPLAV
jgi:hypothetical protein